MEELFAALESGATVVTASRHLARHLADALDRERARGEAAWAGADVLPYAAWLERTWEAGLDAGVWDDADGPPALLNAAQEAALWERVVEGSARSGATLLQPAGAARAARTAWGLLAAWRCRLDAHGALLDADGEALLRWGAAVRRRLERHGWIDSPALPDRLAAAFRAGELAPPRQLVLAGFDTFTPQQEALWEALRAAGAQVHVQTPAPGPGAAVRTACADAAREIEAAAHWARGLLETGVSGPVGIVVPDLAGRRAEVERALFAVLDPGAVLPGSGARPRPFHLSLGAPLAAAPPVHTALQLLELAATARMSLERAGALLRSPFLGGWPQERWARARLDAALRRGGGTEVTAARLRREALSAAGGRPACPRLAAGLGRLADGGPDLPRRATPERWVHAWSRILAAFGWPGDGPLDSTAHQSVEAFRELLSAFAGLGEITGPLDGPGAVGRLARLARERVFQPADDPPAPVQVLGLLEAAGLHFTHLWITGLHDETWPPAPEPHPFIPVALQRRLGMPHADAASERAWAARVTERLLAGAPAVVISHPLRDGDRPLRASPLIAHLPEGRPDDPGAVHPGGFAARVHAAAPGLEAVDDPTGPPLSGAQPAGGGSGLFRDQAACPFRAFARHRLGAVGLERPGPGLDARERGTLVHRVLQAVWDDLGSQRELRASNAQALAARVAAAVDPVLRRFAAEARSGMGARFLALERERLVHLALAWLALEAGRPPFAVAAQERERRTAIGGLEVTLRPDRIDRLPDGRRIVIDYKTGDASTGKWSGDRPDDPQLLLYAAASDAPDRGGGVAALAFAVLRPGRLRFAGFAVEEGILPGVKPPPDGGWEAWLDDRRRVLEDLATRFRAGEAGVDPARGRATCRYCELPTLCRIATDATDDD